MDDRQGNLVPISEEWAKQLSSLKETSVFTKGEILEIKQSRFKVVALGNQHMRLKLLLPLDDVKEKQAALDKMLTAVRESGD